VAYLDPETGHLLSVDVVAQGVDRAFDSKPDRWTRAQDQAEAWRLSHPELSLAE
jgi:hypothetical protein